MAHFATNIFPADGVRTEWDFFFAGVAPDVASGTLPYLFPEDVRAAELFHDADGTPQAAERLVQLVAPNRARIVGAPVAAGRQVKIYRQTEIRFPLVDYRDGQTVSDADLDLANRQAIFVAQETNDAASNNIQLDLHDNFDASGRRIVNVAPGVWDTDAVNVKQLLGAVDRAHRKTLRVPDVEGEVAELAAPGLRSNTLLGFDSAGRPAYIRPVDGSALQLAVDLASSDVPSRNAGMVGYNPALPYAPGTVGGGIQAAVAASAAGDAASAEALAAHSASKTSHPDIRERLDKTTAELEKQAGRVFRGDLRAPVVRLHYAVQRGMGWVTGEPGGQPSTTISADAGTGTAAISVANPGIFRPGQLIVYVGTDGIYRTVGVNRIVGFTLNLTALTLAPVAIGGLVAPFYRDDAHSNIHGAQAIVDEALRTVREERVSTLVSVREPVGLFRNAPGVPAATLTPETTSSHTNPGTTTRPGLRVSAGAGSGGSSAVVSETLILADGEYRISMPINAGARPNDNTGAISFEVIELTESGVGSTLHSQILAGFNGSCNLCSATVTVSRATRAHVRINMLQGGESFAILGQLTVEKLHGVVPDITGAKVVLFGDSWFSPGGEVHSAFRFRLPTTNVVSAGIPGNTAAQMLARFETDVIPLKPDVVFICVGTNDYYQDVTPEVFNSRVHRLRMLCRSIGAVVVFLDAAVGAVVSDASWRGDAMTLSRGYALTTRYLDDCTDVVPTIQTHTVAVTGTIPAGQEQRVLVTPRLSIKGSLLRLARVSRDDLGVRVAYSAAVDGAGAVEKTERVVSADGTVTDMFAPRSSTIAMGTVVSVYNPTTNSLPFSVTLELVTF